MTKKDFLFVILGATGDLTKKKLIPSIFNLIDKKKVNKIAIVGVARKDGSAETLLKSSKKYVKGFNKKSWDKLKRGFYYFKSDFYDNKKFRELGKYLKAVEKKENLSGLRVFYLATLPQHFKAIADRLSRYNLAKKGKGLHRVVFEKPFGQDLRSAKKINKHIKKVFSEKQIYRIDHYLGKELVENISTVRFTNTILEPLWSREHIDHVQIILSEDVGIEERGPFYDKYGAIKDVVQNHMMQLLSLTAMEAPKKLTGDQIRDRKVELLKKVRVNPKDLVVGQFEGYNKIKGIKKNSKTDTFAALKLFVDNKRWKGVPFYLITGKKMKKKITSVYIQFKNAKCLMLKGVCNFLPNYLVIQIQPEEGFYIRMNAKVPGKMDVTAIKMDFCHACTFGPNTPEAYENLLLDVVKGDQSVFVRSDEIEQEWKIVDKIAKKKGKLNIYKKGSHPRQADKFIQKDGRSWHLVVK